MGRDDELSDSRSYRDVLLSVGVRKGRESGKKWMGVYVTATSR